MPEPSIKGFLALALITLLAGCDSGFIGARGAVGFSAAGADRFTGEGDFNSALNVAEATRASGNFPMAIQLYRRAIDLATPDDETTFALIGLGDSLIAVGSYSEAESAYRLVLTDTALEDPEPNGPPLPGSIERSLATYGLGKVFLATGRTPAAMEQFEAARRIQPENLRFLNALAVAHDRIGDHGSAQRLYREGLERAPDDRRLLNNYGLSLMLAGDPELSVGVLTRAARRGNSGPRERINLALAYGMAGDMTQAADIWRIDLGDSAVRNNTDFVRMLGNLDIVPVDAIALEFSTPLNTPGLRPTR